MGCRCGGKNVPIKKHTPKKASVHKTAVKKGGSKEGVKKAQSAASKKATRVAKAAAAAKPNPYAKGCTGCSK